MTVDNLTLLLLAAPAAMLLTTLAAWRQPGPRPWLVERLSVGAAGFSIVVAAIGIALLIGSGPMQSALWGAQGLGFAIRLDALSLTMFTMIALLGFNIVRFSRTYMDGDERQGVFLGRLTATIASVQLLVLSGNLAVLLVAWVLTSLTLHQLLVFYRERRGAVVAARKKYIAARIGDLALFGAAALLYLQFGTGDLEQIFVALQGLAGSEGIPGYVEGAAALIAVAAILKSAQFPTHSWLVEVMETPTPVSALLHAGILNAGPFLVVRMSFVFEQATIAPLLLILFGGFTALFASKALLTQHSIKVGLGYSSAAHMGFMLMICGLGVYAAAILHLVAHSFYKAHAFLSSGSVVDSARAASIDLPRRLGSPLRVLGSVVLALAIFVGFAQVLHLADGTLPLGIILVMGIAQIIAPTLDSDGEWAGVARASLLGVGVAGAFFVLEITFAALLASVVPAVIDPTPAVQVGIWTVVAVFGLATLFQIFRPAGTDRAWQRRLALHLRNGLYANAAFDRLVGALRTSAAGR
jgi:NAD(P)H-quinone oxidoreductase subunit 5